MNIKYGSCYYILTPNFSLKHHFNKHYICQPNDIQYSLPANKNDFTAVKPDVIKSCVIAIVLIGLQLRIYSAYIGVFGAEFSRSINTFRSAVSCESTVTKTLKRVRVLTKHSHICHCNTHKKCDNLTTL